MCFIHFDEQNYIFRIFCIRQLLYCLPVVFAKLTSFILSTTTSKYTEESAPPDMRTELLEWCVCGKMLQQIWIKMQINEKKVKKISLSTN